MSVTSELQEYAQRIRNLRRANPNVPEPALAPAFQQLIQGLLPLLTVPQGLTVMPEFNNPGVGRPDIALVQGAAPPRAFIELKAPTKPADPERWTGQDRRQYERFRELLCWATCNFAEFRLREGHEETGWALVVPQHALRADRSDAAANQAIAGHDPAPFLELVRRICIAAANAPSAADALQLATAMAHAARLVRGIVRDRLAELHSGNPGHPLLQVRQEFRDVLYSHPEAGGYSARDFDELFSGAFAQTLAFGLLLVREATGHPAGPGSWQEMPPEHPLMRTALRVLSQPEVVQDVGIGFTVLSDTVSSFAPEILAIQPDGRDPILYFYEHFLETFDPLARERYGVYYTPVPVVRYIVGALDRTLRENFQTQGLSDAAVTILDPATGTGTFLLGIAERVRQRAEQEAGPGMAALALRNLATRMFGFELLVGPYAVAHYRLHHALRTTSPVGEPGSPLALSRLGVYLADTLARPGSAAPAGPLGFVAAGIADEQREANRVKAEQPILAITGNPPYRRLREGENRTLVGDWLDHIWDDLKEPVRQAGHANQLNTFPELSVAFWRWAIWKMFEADNAPGRGIVAFITNRTFLTGWPYAGLRKMMRERFDRIEIIDLRGDVRLGQPAGVFGDQGVFDIQVGTAITLAIADGSKVEAQPAEVLYLDSWVEGQFSRTAKFEWLLGGAEIGTLPTAVAVDRGWIGDFRPLPFQNGEWISITESFVFYRSGLQTKRDNFVYDPNRDRLRDRIGVFLSSDDDRAREIFHDTRDRKWSSAQAIPLDEDHLALVSYRPLDRRWLYNQRAYGDFLRTDLQRVWGASNVALYALPGGAGAGPAVWCHGLLPDYHSFRGSYGGYAFPLYDRRPNVNAPNLSPSLVESLSAAYGEPVAAEDVFDAILCLLSARSYTLRFAEDLEDVFPHIPFPAQRAVFAEAVRLGREIRAVEIFARAPRPEYRPPSLARVATQPQGEVASVDYRDRTIELCADGSGRITGIPEPVWNFEVSGYRVLPRWIESRVGLPADLGLVSELRDVSSRISELIDLFADADIVLEQTLQETLTRAALGLGDEAQDEDDAPT